MYLHSCLPRRARLVVVAGSHLALLDGLYVGVALVFAAVYALLGSYGVSIIVIGAGISLLASPLAVWAWRSQVGRARLVPELDELNLRFRDDPQQRVRESAALFKEHGVSPWSGCLPALLPAPIYIGLYQVLQGLTHRPPGAVTFQPRFITHSSRLFHSLAASTTMQAWGVDLARTGAAAVQLSASSAGLFVGLVAVTAIAGVWQQRLVRTALPRAETPAEGLANRIAVVVPALFAIWGLLLPLAVTLYYASSSVVRLAQQWLLVKVHPF